MKRLAKYLIIVSFFFFSCNDDFMQQDPMQELAEGVFFKNEGDLPLYLNQLYDAYIVGHQRGNAYDAEAPLAIQGSAIVFADLASDNAVAFTGTAGDPDTRLRGTFITPNSGTGTGWEWNKLRSVNYFLRH